MPHRLLIQPECLADWKLFDRSIRLACVRARGANRCAAKLANPSQLAAALVEVGRLHGLGQSVGLRRGCDVAPTRDLVGTGAVEEEARRELR